MNARRACLTIALSMIVLAAPTLATAAAESTAIEPAPESVLFVGNSHTSRHGGLDWLVGNFVAAEAGQRSFDGAALTEGGVTLEYHWNNGTPQRVRSGDYDTVVLQGYLAGSDAASADLFLEHARLLDSVIERSGAETVFFMTWPRGFDDWSNVDDAIEAHRTISAELGAAVAPAALAFERARSERPDLKLIDDDLVHATWDGAYLAAATVYATVFERSPEGLPYSFGMDTETAAFLQRIAWEAVTEWNEGSAA